MSALEIRNVVVSYAGLLAVQDVSLSLASGQMLGISGPNGAGKTSLLRAIAGLVPLREGSIRLDGRALNDASLMRRPSPRSIVKQGLCLVPEGRRLFSGLNVEDHLRFGAYLVGSKHVLDDLDRVYAIFPKLAERRHQDVSTLSGGEKQMVAVGRGLMSKPKLLMIDELSLGLAPVVVNELVDALCNLNTATGLGIVVVDECLGRLRSSVSQIAFLAHGKLQTVLAPELLSGQTASLYMSLQD